MQSKFKWGRLLLSGASITAMSALTPAFAQDNQTETIVVTATGRAAAIQDVPLAVTGLNAEAIENAGVDNLYDVEQLVPSFRIYAGQSTTTGTIARVRGVGTGSDNPGFESAVGIFIDGVYRARSGVAMSDLPELERVEILRGPQGTLFGRNTSAGAISVVTAGPDFDSGAWAEATISNLDGRAVRAGFTGPLVQDVLAFRVDGSYRKRDGYITDANTGDDINTQDRWTARAQALWDITPDASLRVVLDAASTDEICCGVTTLVYGVTQPAITAIVGSSATVPGQQGAINTRFEEREMTTTPGREYTEQVDEQGISAQLDWDLGGAQLTSITGYRSWEALRNQDVDFNRIDIAYRDGLEIGFDTFTQEIRLQGEWGRVDWLVGVFYGDEKLDTTDRIRLGAHANAYINALTQGNTAALRTAAHPLLGPLSGPAVVGPFEFFDSTANDDDNPQIWGQEALLLGQSPTVIGNAQGIPLPQDPVESVFYFAGLGGYNPFPNVPGLASSNTGLQNAYLTPSPSGSGQQADNWSQDTNSLALFTHNEITLAENLILTLGLRYNQETKDLSANLLSTSPTCASMQGLETATGPSVPGPGGIITALLASPLVSLINLACNPAINSIANGQWQGDREENEMSGTVNLAYHVTEDVMIYGGYSRGYKSGGYNVDRSGFAITPAVTSAAALSVDQLEFGAEFVDAYEAGVKSTVFGGTTDLNVNVFYQQLHDYQSNNFNGFNFITRNIPEAISQGVELDILARPTSRLTFQGGALYNESFYDSTVVFNPSSPAANTIFEGQAFDHAPLWSITGAVSYEQPISDNLRATFYLDARHNSSYRNQTLSRDARTDQEAFTVFNGRVALGNPDGGWALEAWVKNIADKFYTVGAFQATLQDGTMLLYPGEPRTYGLTLKARY